MAAGGRVNRLTRGWRVKVEVIGFEDVGVVRIPRDPVRPGVGGWAVVNRDTGRIEFAYSGNGDPVSADLGRLCYALSVVVFWDNWYGWIVPFESPGWATPEEAIGRAG